MNSFPLTSRSIPTWPVGQGKAFLGVYDRWNWKILRFERAEGGSNRVPVIEALLDEPTLCNELSDRMVGDLRDGLELFH